MWPWLAPLRTGRRGGIPRGWDALRGEASAPSDEAERASPTPCECASAGFFFFFRLRVLLLMGLHLLSSAGAQERAPRDGGRQPA